MMISKKEYSALLLIAVSLFMFPLFSFAKMETKTYSVGNDFSDQNGKTTIVAEIEKQQEEEPQQTVYRSDEQPQNYIVIPNNNYFPAYPYYGGTVYRIGPYSYSVNTGIGNYNYGGFYYDYRGNGYHFSGGTVPSSTIPPKPPYPNPKPPYPPPPPKNKDNKYNEQRGTHSPYYPNKTPNNRPSVPDNQSGVSGTIKYF